MDQMIMRRFDLCYRYMAIIPAILFSALLLSSCSGTPSSGPSTGSYDSAADVRVNSANDRVADSGKLPFVLVDVNAHNANILERNHAQTRFMGAFTDRRDAADIRIGLGDVIRVTIFEAGSGGLFVPTGATLNAGNFVSIPDQEVDRTGSIKVPYASENGDGGIIRVYNRRPIDIQREIEERLADRAIEPQVVVTIANRNSNKFSVMGDVATPGRYEVKQGGLRILDAISQAGGTRSPEYNSLVTLQRGGQTATARLSLLIKEPENNIFIRPGDVVTVNRDDQYYNAFGAVSKNGHILFDAQNLSVADGIGKAGGLDDQRADPSSVIIYREESIETLKQVGASLEAYPYRKVLPTVYRINLEKPEGFFLAQKMPLRHSDALYVSNKPLANLGKITTILRDILLIRLIDN